MLINVQILDVIIHFLQMMIYPLLFEKVYGHRKIKNASIKKINMKKIHVPLIPIAFLPTMPRPISFSRRDKEIVQITWKVKFTDDSKYVLPSEDQLDWNKLCGLTFSPMFNAKKNSILIGWHYDPVKDEFRITPYLHDHLGKVTYLKPSQS